MHVSVCVALLQLWPLLLLLLQVCVSGAEAWGALKNDATELITEFTEEHTPHTPPQQDRHPPGNSTINQAKNGGRRQSANTGPQYGASELSCRELRSTRYITDGSCRSAKPVKELVCSGQCLPAHLMANSILRSKWWRSNASDYRCVPAHARTQRVQLHCPNGQSRTYKIRVVTSCKCKRYTRHHNQSDVKEPSQKQRRNKKHTRVQQSRGRSREPTISSNSY
ncbi:sclerostin [Hoplias malabaricus]|uniref:sclerostin n=1 Tax=Hoplias malabaricus TaxID=27720 RepID=UPI003463272B